MTVPSRGHAEIRLEALSSLLFVYPVYRLHGRRISHQAVDLRRRPIGTNRGHQCRRHGAYRDSGHAWQAVLRRLVYLALTCNTALHFAAVGLCRRQQHRFELTIDFGKRAGKSTPVRKVIDFDQLLGGKAGLIDPYNAGGHAADGRGETILSGSLWRRPAL